MPGTIDVTQRRSSSTKAHVAGTVAAAAYVVAWWWWLPNISQQATEKGFNFSWLLLWLVAGVAVSYATAALAVVAIRRLTRSRRHQRYH